MAVMGRSHDVHPRSGSLIYFFQWAESLFPFPCNSLMAVGRATSLELSAVNRDGKTGAIDEAQARLHPGNGGWSFLDLVHGY